MSEKKKEKVVQAARQVFLRYGFRRVTMNDLAEAANMSRPALYLVFPSKEDVFTAVMTQIFAEMLNEIRQGIDQQTTPRDKLTFAMEIWCISPFEMIQKFPDAKDLLESSHEFATELTAGAVHDFTRILADVLDPLVQKQSEVTLSTLQIAHVLVGSLVGFKALATSVGQFRQWIADLLEIVLASLQSPAGS